jgi:hypothetical protein
MSRLINCIKKLLKRSEQPEQPGRIKPLKEWPAEAYKALEEERDKERKRGKIIKLR